MADSTTSNLAEQIKQLQDTNRLSKLLGNTYEKLIEQTKKVLEEQKKLSLEEEKINTEAETELELKQKVYALAVRNSEQIASHLRDLREEIQLLEQKENSDEKLSEQEQNSLIALRLKVAETNKLLQSLQENYKLEVKRQELIKLNKQVEAYKKIEGFVVSITKKTLGVGPAKENWISKLANDINKIDFNKVITHGFKVLAQQVHPVNLLQSALEKVQESTIKMVQETYDAFAGFNKATGMAGEYNDAILEMSQTHRTFGIGVAESAQVFQSLYVEMSGFTQLTPRTQKEVTSLTAKLTGMGVESGTTAKLLDTLTKGLKLSTDASIKLSTRLAIAGNSFGITSQKMIEGFSKAAPKLAGFGKQAGEIFIKLTKQSKDLGIEVDELIGLVSKFETFEGAADAAGKLNAILGGNVINSTQLLAASLQEPEQAVLQLRQAVQLSGKDFTKLSNAEQKAIADTIGLADNLDLARRLLGGTSSEFAKAREEAKTFAEMQERVAESARNSKSAMQEIKMLVESFAVAVGWLAKGLNWLISKFNLISDKLGSFFAVVLVGVLLITSAFLKFRIAAWAAASAGPAIGGGLKAAGEGANSAAPGFMKLGLAMLEFGASFALIIGSIALLIYVMSRLAPDQAAGILGILVVIGIGLNFLIKTLAAAAPQAVAAAKVILAIGGAIALVIIGLAAGFFIFAKAIEVLANVSDKLLPLAVGLGALMLAIAFTGPAGLLGVISLTTLTGSLLILGIALAAIRLDKINALTSLLGNLKTLSPLSTGIRAVAAAIKEIGDAIADLPESKTLAFATASDAFTSTVKATSTLTPTAVEATKQIVAQAASYVEVQAKLKAPDADAFVVAMKAATVANEPGTITRGGEKGRDVILMLNERELGRAVKAILDSDMNLRIGR